MNKSPFIVFDGPNGVGKTTIINAVCDQLNILQISHVRTKEPTSSELGVYIRKNQDKYSKEVLACLVAANRYEHLQTVVTPGIQAGNIVLCDRYFPSSLVYQLMDGLELLFVEGLNQQILIPHLTIFLTAKEEVVKTRLRERDQLTRFERDQKKEIQLYQEAQALLENKGWNILSIDTDSQTVSAIAELIVQEIKKVINDH
jgi:dTMP kinase